MKKWIAKIWDLSKKTKKINKEDMNEAEIQRLMSLKDNFVGQSFQWIKSKDENLLGKVVRCRDIVPSGRGTFTAKFEDGSSINAGLINSSLMMIHDGAQPLSKREIRALNPPPVTKKEAPTNPNIVVDPNQVTGKTESVAKPKPAAPQPVAETPNIFAMFSDHETNMQLNVNMNLPDKKLLKMMYKNAEDEEKFVDQLSTYVHSQINKQVIRESLLKILNPTQKGKLSKNEGGNGVVATEVKD